MKKLLAASTLFVFFIGSNVAQSSLGYKCTTSSNPENNTGKCRELSSGNGDMCFTYGEGTACDGDTSGLG